jgi:hypothetical protein
VETRTDFFSHEASEEKTMQNKNMQPIIVIIILLTFIFAVAAPAKADPLKSLSDLFSFDGSKKGKDAKVKASNDAASGCLAGALLAKSQGLAIGQGCMSGAVQNAAVEREKNLSELQHSEKQERAEGDKNLETLNHQTVERQSQVVQLVAKQENTPVSVMERLKQWLVPASNPEVKTQLNGIDSDIESTRNFISDLRKQISEKEKSIDKTVDIEERMIIAHEVSDLYADLKQAEYLQAANIELRKELDGGQPGMLAILTGILVSIGAVIRNKILEIVFKRAHEKFGVHVTRLAETYLKSKKQHGMY